MELTIDDPAKRILLANYRVYKKRIHAQELAKLIADNLKSTILEVTVQTMLDKLKDGGAVDGDRVNGYIPLYDEVA